MAISVSNSNNSQNISAGNYPTTNPATAPEENDIDIVKSLANGLSEISSQVSYFNGYLEGGNAAFNSLLSDLYSKFAEKDQSVNINKENLYQIGLMDVVIHAKDYGLDGDADFLKNVGYLLEYTGSGQHNNQVEATHALDAIQSVFDKIKAKIQSGYIPATSLAARVFNDTVDTSIYSFNNYYADNDQSWIKQTSTELSPLMRLEALGRLLKRAPLSYEKINVFLAGSKKNIDDLYKENTGKEFYEELFSTSSTSSDDATPTTESRWGDIPAKKATGKIPAGALYALDYSGALSSVYLIGLSDNYPSRQLISDEITKVNRLGDQAKIIYELLKYKLNNERDTRMQISQNV